MSIPKNYCTCCGEPFFLVDRAHEDSTLCNTCGEMEVENEIGRGELEAAEFEDAIREDEARETMFWPYE